MARKVLSGLIQASNPINDESQVGRRDPGGDAREAPADDPRRRQEGRPDPLPAGDLQRPVLLPRPGQALVRRGRAGARPDRREARADRAEVPDGDGRPALRARDGRRLLQHRRRHRRRRHVPRQVPQEPHPADERASGRSTSSARATSATRRSRPATRKIGVYICYDRHFPEGARALGLNGAEIVYNPSATVAGLSQYLWKLEQPAHAVANGYFVGAINRVGTEAPWNIGKFYGNSYFVDPRGQIPRDAAARTRTSWSSPSSTST